MSLETKIDERVLQGKLVISKALLTGSRYIYEASKDNVKYMIKGYEILLDDWKPAELDSGKVFIEIMHKITNVLQEFYFFKFASNFSQHFVKPLGIDYEVKVNCLFVEILFEYPGESLYDIGKLDIDTVYNLMRQSTSAISFLHSAEMFNLDIQPSSMTYDKTADLLKVINIGHDTNAKVKAFYPPEGPQNDKKTDIYSLAMTFYSLLSGIKEEGLQREDTKTRESYETFEKTIKENIEKLEASDMAKYKKKVLLEEIMKAVSFDSKTRQEIFNITNAMKKFEEEQKVKFSYIEYKDSFNRNLVKSLDLNIDSRIGNFSNNDK